MEFVFKWIESWLGNLVIQQKWLKLKMLSVLTYFLTHTVLVGRHVTDHLYAVFCQVVWAAVVSKTEHTFNADGIRGGLVFLDWHFGRKNYESQGRAGQSSSVLDLACPTLVDMTMKV